jgi:hypothetical protein
MTAAIEVVAIRPTDGKSSVKAFCNVKIGGVTVKGAKIVRQVGQRPWLAMPAVKTDHGWQNIIELSKPLRDRVTEVVLAAWQDLPASRQEILPPSRAAERGRASAPRLAERGQGWTRGARIVTVPIAPNGDELDDI